MTSDPAPKTPKVPEAPAPEEGTVSAEGIAYQAPSRPFAEMAEPGSAPEVDPDVEAKRKAQAEEAAARYK